MYTPEACPPEFPMESLYVCLPEIKPDYSFDIWGLGILLFEIATGKPFYDGGLTDVDFIKVNTL
jgi:serine/threonine protein kinase